MAQPPPTDSRRRATYLLGSGSWSLVGDWHRTPRYREVHRVTPVAPDEGFVYRLGRDGEFDRKHLAGRGDIEGGSHLMNVYSTSCAGPPEPSVAQHKLASAKLATAPSKMSVTSIASTATAQNIPAVRPDLRSRLPPGLRVHIIEGTVNERWQHEHQDALQLDGDAALHARSGPRSGGRRCRAMTRSEGSR